MKSLDVQTKQGALPDEKSIQGNTKNDWFCVMPISLLKKRIDIGSVFRLNGNADKSSHID